MDRRISSLVAGALVFFAAFWTVRQSAQAGGPGPTVRGCHLRYQQELDALPKRTARGLELIEGAYVKNARFTRAVKSVNRQLKKMGQPETTEGNAAELIRIANEASTLCPIVRHYKDGTPMRSLFSYEQVKRHLLYQVKHQRSTGMTIASASPLADEPIALDDDLDNEGDEDEKNV